MAGLPFEVNTDRLRALLDVSAERDRQDHLHPLHEGCFHEELRLAILVEEVGEVGKALIEGGPSDVRTELVQVAATAVRWCELLDREVGA